MADGNRDRRDDGRDRNQGPDDRTGGFGQHDAAAGYDQRGYQGYVAPGSERRILSEADERYLAVRNRYGQQLDVDFRRFREERLHDEFDRWRRDREQTLEKIRGGMEVVDTDGTRIGTVDKVEGGHVKLTLRDQGEGRPHRYLTPSWIASVDDKVRLKGSIDEAERLWRTEENPNRRYR